VVEGDSSSDNSDATKAPPEGQRLRVELTGLIQLARTAYDQKRRKDSLALTNAILKIDPASNDARLLQSLIESDINLALQRIHAMVKNPLMKNEEFRANAFQLLQSVLEIDPTNKAAEKLIPAIDPAAKRDQSPSSPAPDSKARIQTEKRSNPPEWGPPEPEPPKIVDTEEAKPNSPRTRNTLLVFLVLLIVVAVLAAHFGLVSAALNRFGFSGKRKQSSTTILESIPRTDLANSISPRKFPSNSGYFDRIVPQDRSQDGVGESRRS
jgi:hypothetical protein